MIVQLIRHGKKLLSFHILYCDILYSIKAFFNMKNVKYHKNSKHEKRLIRLGLIFILGLPK